MVMVMFGAAVRAPENVLSSSQVSCWIMGSLSHWEVVLLEDSLLLSWIIYLFPLWTEVQYEYCTALKVAKFTCERQRTSPTQRGHHGGHNYGKYITGRKYLVLKCFWCNGESFNNIQFLAHKAQFLEIRKLSGWEASASSSEYVTSMKLVLWYLHIKIDILTDQDTQRGVGLRG